MVLLNASLLFVFYVTLYNLSYSVAVHHTIQKCIVMWSATIHRKGSALYP